MGKQLSITEQVDKIKHDRQAQFKKKSSHKINYNTMLGDIYDCYLSLDALSDSDKSKIQLRTKEKLQAVRTFAQEVVDKLNNIITSETNDANTETAPSFGDISDEDAALLLDHLISSDDKSSYNINKVDSSSEKSNDSKSIDTQQQDTTKSDTNSAVNEDQLLNAIQSGLLYEDAVKLKQEAKQSENWYRGSDHIDQETIDSKEVEWANNYLSALASAAVKSGKSSPWARTYYSPLSVYTMSELQKRVLESVKSKSFNHTTADLYVILYMRHWNPKEYKNKDSILYKKFYPTKIIEEYPDIKKFFNDLNGFLVQSWNNSIGKPKHKYDQEKADERKKTRKEQLDSVNNMARRYLNESDFRDLDHVTCTGVAMSRINEQLHLRYSCNLYGAGYYCRPGQLIKNFESLLWEQGNMFDQGLDVESFDFDLGRSKIIDNNYVSDYLDEKDRATFDYDKFWQLAVITYYDKTFCENVDWSTSKAKRHGPCSMLATDFQTTNKNINKWKHAVPEEKFYSIDSYTDVCKLDSSDDSIFITRDLGNHRSQRIIARRGAYFTYTPAACYLAYLYMTSPNCNLVTWDDTNPETLNLQDMLTTLYFYGPENCQNSDALRACVDDAKFDEDNFMAFLYSVGFRPEDPDSESIKTIFKYLFIHNPDDRITAEKVCSLGKVRYSWNRSNTMYLYDCNPTSLYFYSYTNMNVFRYKKFQIVDNSYKRHMIAPLKKLNENEKAFAHWIIPDEDLVYFERFADWKNDGEPEGHLYFSKKELAVSDKVKAQKVAAGNTKAQSKRDRYNYEYNKRFAKCKKGMTSNVLFRNEKAG